MASIAMSVAKDKASSAISSIKGKVGGKPAIKWEEFNYPPLLQIIHYDLSELQPPHKGVVFKMWLTHLNIFIISILNIISNIAQAASGESGFRVMYGFVFFFFFNPIATAAFYRGYQGICADNFLLQFYQIASVILAILWVIFSITSFAGFDGFVRVSYLMKYDMTFAGILGIVQSILFLINALLTGFCVFLAHNFQD